MNDIIAKMRSELRGVLKASVAAYPGVPRDKWLFDWPSQIILVVNQIFWCQEVEQVRAGRQSSCEPRAGLWDIAAIVAGRQAAHCVHAALPAAAAAVAGGVEQAAVSNHSLSTFFATLQTSLPPGIC